VKIRLDNIRFSYNKGNSVLKGVSFEVDPGRCTALIGPNASGKSTLLKCLIGILKPDGNIYLDEAKHTEFKRGEIVKQIGFLPQDNGSRALITVYEMVLLGRLQSLTWKVSPRDHQLTERVMNEIGIAHLAARYLNELSGGQRQLVSFAQTLTREPSVLLLDEPTNSLDLQHEFELMETVKTIAQKKGITTLITLHDLNLAARFADRLVVLKDGKIIANGRPEDVLTEGLIETVYGVNAKILKQDGFIQVFPIRRKRG
jgi:iron complex transport system ATP-binding protein